MHQPDKMDIYRRLREKLDQMATGYPATESGVELRILQKLFTEQDAEFFLAIGTDATTSRELSRSMDINRESLEAKLSDMALRGILFREQRNGEILYRAVPFIVGMYEYQIGRLSPDILKDIMEYYVTALGKSFFQSKITHLRTIPVDAKLVPGQRVSSYEDAAVIIKSKKRIAVTECICRKAARMSGMGCSHSLETCLQFDAHAEYYVNNGIGRYISTDEALHILKKSEEEGLVLQALNSKNVEVLCTCCSCCCGMLVALRSFPAPAREVLSNHVCRMDIDKCINCETCVGRCPVRAFKPEDGRIIFRQERCIGCGLCIDICCGKALSLERKPENQIYTPSETIQEAYEIMAENRKEIK